MKDLVQGILIQPLPAAVGHGHEGGALAMEKIVHADEVEGVGDRTDQVSAICLNLHGFFARGRERPRDLAAENSLL